MHSVADTGNQGLLLLGGSRAKRDATKQHPFGYGRERYFWAFAVALVLFSLGGMFALYEGIDKFLDPHEPRNLPIAMGILVLGIALESYSLGTAVKEANHVRPDGVSAAPTATVIYIEPDLLSDDHSDLPTSPDGSR